jgi:hypothetical protein
MFEAINILGKQGHTSPRFKSFVGSPSMTDCSIWGLLCLWKASKSHVCRLALSIACRNVSVGSGFTVIWLSERFCERIMS